MALSLIVGNDCIRRQALVNVLLSGHTAVRHTRWNRLNMETDRGAVVLDVDMDETATNMCQSPAFVDLLMNARARGLVPLVVCIRRVGAFPSPWLCEFDDVYLLDDASPSHEMARLHKMLVTDGTTTDQLSTLCQNSHSYVRIDTPGSVTAVPFAG